MLLRFALCVGLRPPLIFAPAATVLGRKPGKPASAPPGKSDDPSPPPQYR